MGSEMRDEVHFGRLSLCGPLSLWLCCYVIVLRYVASLCIVAFSYHVVVVAFIVNVALRRLIVVLRLYLMCVVASRCRVGMSPTK